MNIPQSHPVLSIDEAAKLEERLLGEDDKAQWVAMQSAGRSLARGIIEDAEEAGGLLGAARVLVLAGKGHNAGDAFIAAFELLERLPQARIDVFFVLGERPLRPLAMRAWKELSDGFADRVCRVNGSSLASRYDVCIGAVAGLRYKPPLHPRAVWAIALSAASRIRMRVSVDLPSGLDDPGAFASDFTYATGSVKAPLLSCRNAGRLRYLDLGFFNEEPAEGVKGPRDRVLVDAVLDPLRGLRPAHSDKRSQGHLAIVGGSAGTPGAVLMATVAALRSGVGLVTAFVPRSLVPAFAARAPEAMWVGLAETKDGALSLAGLERIRNATQRATALLMGPGLGDKGPPLALAEALARSSKIPMVIDADALRPGIVGAGEASRILTPHAGEFARISRGLDLPAVASELNAVVVLKGSVTRIGWAETVYHSFFGGPVLSRGGSGDVLAGLAGGLLAQDPGQPLCRAAQAVVWHGRSADLLARSQGQTSATAMDLVPFLPRVLREPIACPTQ